MHTQRQKAMRGLRQKMAIHRSKREASRDMTQAGTLVLDFQLPELLESNFLLFKPPTCGILSWQPYRRQQKWFMQLRALKLLYHWLLPTASSPIRQAEFPIPL